MVNPAKLPLVAAILFVVGNVWSATFYVDVNSPVPTPPYASWATAATTIQDAIDAASDGDLVLVTNGVYATGGKVMFGDLTNRVALDKAITVQSVNGPFVTTIRGNGATNGPNAVRCAWITNGATLQGFTLTAGATRTSGDPANLVTGGGAWCLGDNAVIQNCLVVSNVAQVSGGGVFRGRILNTALQGNRSATSASIISSAILVNCTVVSNFQGAATFQCRVTNSIVYHNTPANHAGTTFSYSCTTPAAGGVGNITNAPLLAPDGIHLLSTSPCLGAGGNFVTGTDIDGHLWRNPPAMGCDEGSPFPQAVLSAFRFDAWGRAGISVTLTGQPPMTFFWKKDEQIISTGEVITFSTNFSFQFQFLDPTNAGNYQVVLSNSFGLSTSQVAPLTIRCVDVASSAATPPFSSWATAATNIQDALESAQPGDVVLVAPGIYGRGGKPKVGDLTNRVVLDKAVTLMSVAGPTATIIQGAWDVATTNGPGAVRGVWMTNGAALMGFTVRGGATRTGGMVDDNSGGGIWCSSTNALVSECIIEGSAAAGRAGVFRGRIVNSLIRQNRGGFGVGGAASSVLVNCTVTGNVGSHATGGVEGCRVYNSVIWQNAGFGPGNFVEYNNSSFTNSCTKPLPSGSGNISADPLFDVDGFHLRPESPCVNAGSALFATGVDIDGQPWSNPPAMGCDQRWANLAVGQPQLIPTGDGKIRLRGIPVGAAPTSYWWFKDDSLVNNDSRINGAQTMELAIRAFEPGDVGWYQLVVSNQLGSATSAVLRVKAKFVDVANINPSAPYSNWLAAANTIQAAVDAADFGDLIVVADGVYATGGLPVSGDLTNRVVLSKAVVVTSLNGATNAVIEGQQDLIGPNGNGNDAVRPVWMENWTTLAGFTIRNGATRTDGTISLMQSGGGVFAMSDYARVYGSVITNNSAHQNGGGAMGAYLQGCRVVGNTATNGGGIYGGTAINSYLTQNRALSRVVGAVGGGGAAAATLRNSVIHRNYAYDIGNISANHGGVSGCNLYNCTVTENDGNGMFFGFAYNTVSWGNRVRDYAGSLSMHYSCANFSIANYGSNNVYADPQLVDAFHVAENSPVRGAGGPLLVTGTDFDGDPWESPVSMGADEFTADAASGDLSVSIELPPAPVYPNRLVQLVGRVTGRAARIEWSLGEGPVLTNVSYATRSAWANPGNYQITFTAYNTSNPFGVSTSVILPVVAVPPASWANFEKIGGYYRFDINTQVGVTNTIEFATNLTAPIFWMPLKSTVATNVLMREFDFTATNAARYYRLRAQ